jgi:hypothetical protein
MICGYCHKEVVLPTKDQVVEYQNKGIDVEYVCGCGALYAKDALPGMNNLYIGEINEV